MDTITLGMGYGFGRFLDLEVDPGGMGGAEGPAGTPAAPAGGETGGGADPYAERFSTLEGRFGRLEQLLEQRLATPEPPAPGIGAEMPEYDPWDPKSVAAHLRAELGLDALDQMQHVVGSMAQQRAQEIATQRLEELKGQIGEFDTGLAQTIASAFVAYDDQIDDGTAFTQAAQAVRGYHQQVEQAARADERAKVLAELGMLADEATNGVVAPAMGSGTIATRAEEVPSGPDKYRQVLARHQSARAARHAGA